MVSVARIIPPPKTQRAATHYYEALEGVLTKRFMVCAQFIAYATWIASIIMGVRATTFGWIWWLLPFRAIPILIGLYSILILRKVKKLLHVDNLQYSNLISELFDRIFGSTVFLRVLSVYTFSSVIFYWLYKNEMATETIGFTIRPRQFEPPILNERYIYLSIFSLYVAVSYSLLYVICDYDHLRFKIQTMDIPARKRILSQINDLTTLSVAYAIFVTLTFPIIYWIFLRRFVWEWTLYFARYFFKLHRSNAYFNASSPFGIKMLVDTFYSSLILFWLWELANTSFSVYMSLKPIHNGQFISERSSNKNETLVTGLSSKKRPLLRIMAFQELWLIALNSKERRVSIYSDIFERNNDIAAATGVTQNQKSSSSSSSRWDQIQKECLSVIEDVIDQLKEKPKPRAEPANQSATNINSDSNSILSIKQDNSIFAKANATSTSNHFQDNQAQHSQEFIGHLEKIWKFLQKYIENYSQPTKKFLNTPIGYPFRCTIERKINKIIPSPLLICCAILSLSLFISKSLQEDQYGIVHRHIPDVLNALDQLLTLIERFIKNPPYHWTDVKPVKEPDLTSLKQIYEVADDGFEQIILSFSGYLNRMNLSDEVKKRIRTVQQQQKM